MAKLRLLRKTSVLETRVVVTPPVTTTKTMARTMKTTERTMMERKMKMIEDNRKDQVKVKCPNNNRKDWLLNRPQQGNKSTNRMHKSRR